MKILAVIIVALIAVCWLVAIPQTYRSKRNGKYVVSFSGKEEERISLSNIPASLLAARWDKYV